MFRLCLSFSFYFFLSRSLYLCSLIDIAKALLVPLLVFAVAYAIQLCCCFLRAFFTQASAFFDGTRYFS